MPTWNQISKEIQSLDEPDAADKVRKKYLEIYESIAGRPAIAYYSGFLSKVEKDGRYHAQCMINDLDMNGFMAVSYGLDRDKGLDLFLHTPGGGIEAARGIVEYLYKMFGRNLRAIVPQLAMSAGTMIACATKEILMGKHSCLGPTDPQIRGYAAMGILSEVDRAIDEIKKDPARQILWQQIFSKYPPAFISDCERSVEGARVMVKDWLSENMLLDCNGDAEKVVSELMNYIGTSEHSQHFLIDKCISIGLKVKALEADQNYQEAVLSVHHSFMASFEDTDALKIIDNSRGGTWSVSS